MEEQALEQIKQLFKESYKVLYADGAFDTMADQIEADGGDVVPGVSQLVATIITSAVQDAGVNDLGVLFGLAIMLISDLLASLQEVGVEAPEDSFQQIINKAMQMVLGENPTLAEAIQANPDVQAAMQAMGGPEGIKQAADAGGEVAQGVMDGAEAAQGGL